MWCLGCVPDQLLVRPAKNNTTPFVLLNFSHVCLSRACLGKMITCSIQLLQKRRCAFFAPLHGPRRALKLRTTQGGCDTNAVQFLFNLLLRMRPEPVLVNRRVPSARLNGMQKKKGGGVAPARSGVRACQAHPDAHAPRHLRKPHLFLSAFPMFVPSLSW